MRRFSWQGERGSSMVEFALLSPVIFTVLLGIMELALMFHAWLAVQHASELGARYAITGQTSCTSGGANRISCIQSEAKQGTKTLKNGNSAIVSVQSWTYPTYTTNVQNSAGNQCDAMEVKVVYNYQSITPAFKVIKSTIKMTGKQRFINEPFFNCK